MKIHNEYKTEWVKLEKLEEENYHWGSLHIRVHIKTKHFDSYFQGIWIELSQIEEFIHALETLDEQRSGQVVLSSMAGEAMQLMIKATDERGHLALGIRIEKRSSNSVWQDT